MSTTDALIYVENIRAALAAADPANAEVYAANAAAYAAEIEALAAPIRERLASIPEARRWLATSEGAFAYLTRDFGLGEIYIWPINEANTGTPQQIRRAIDLIREHDVPVIFSESTVDPRSAQQVARETGIAYGGVLYVDSLSPPDGPVPSYLDLMRATTTTIADGAGAMSGLSVRDVTVTYRTGLTALDDATFTLPEGSITALVGVNGSGKSTLFKAIMGFVPLRSGSVEILGMPREAALKRNLVAYVPQAEEVDWTFPVLVEDVVMMGRYGHMGWLRRPRRATASWSRRRWSASAWPTSPTGRSANCPAARRSASSSPARWRRRAG